MARNRWKEESDQHELVRTCAQSVIGSSPCGAQPASNQAVAFTKGICNYIFDTYGRFPAHCDAFHVPGVRAQFSHLELEYYEKFYDANQFTRQNQHAAIWEET